jgi:beta-N-acetylhexosaminidase
LLDEVQPGGICLFARNIKERKQTRDLVDELRTKLDNPLLSIDQEGGLVDRLRRVLTPMPAADKIRTVDDAIELARIIARALRIFGLNMNFAPDVDVIDEDRSKFSNGLHSRAFGRSKDDAAKLSSAFLKTMQDGGVFGCLKHFPGLGASEVDSHKELPSVSISEDELREVDLHPYRVLFDEQEVRAVMVAHAAFPNTGLQEQD